jgi:hypothetical protein
MNISLSRMASPAVLLYLFLTVAQVASGIYLAAEAEPPPAFTLLYALGFLWVVGWWLLGDSRERGVAWVFDMGLFLYIAWPVVMPYYLLKTRGAKGLLVILGFVGAYVGALIAGVALYILLTPSPG